MALCGIPRIDDLNTNAAGATAIAAGDPDKDSVGLLQQMLAGMGQPGLPNLLSPDYGVFGPRTTTAVQNFRAAQGLPAGEAIDAQCLQTLVATSPAVPVASRGYMTLVLNFPYTGLAKIVSVVAQMEGAGKFSALNENTDKAGLSFGLIQWAQKPGRLTEILKAFSKASPDDYVRIFGDGDAGLAARLIAHTQKVKGGIDPATGQTTDPTFDLIDDPWVSRFRQAALFKPFQQVQVQTALDDFANSLGIIQGYAPQLTTERALGFMLDVANQFGDPGLHSIYNAVAQDGMAVSDLLQAIADESVARIQDPWKTGTQARRQHFLTTTFLSDGPFVDADNPAVAA
jgi:peptidoglycan hydrolase-like protein with peptidoglycan-binding domain